MEYSTLDVVRVVFFNGLAALVAGAFGGIGAKWLLQLHLAKKPLVGIFCGLMALDAGFAHGDMTILDAVLGVLGKEAIWYRLILYVGLGVMGWFIYMSAQASE